MHCVSDEAKYVSWNAPSCFIGILVSYLNSFSTISNKHRNAIYKIAVTVEDNTVDFAFAWFIRLTIKAILTRASSVEINIDHLARITQTVIP